MMKAVRCIMLCMVALLTMSVTRAQETTEAPNKTTTVISDKKLFDTLEEYKDADSMNISSFMIGMAKLMATGDEKAFLDNIKSMRIIDLEKCSDADKRRYIEYISSIELQNYEPATDVTDEDSHVRIYLKIKDEVVTNMVIAQWGISQNLIMQINGKLTMSDIERMAKGDNPPIK